mmetsp:Transcript_14103/g.49658  ORF Transcript_14103/g.49658 Transcript_14103/m.49658 type:complete len:205 (+) Transcript_14103:50-664(+)
MRQAHTDGDRQGHWHSLKTAHAPMLCEACRFRHESHRGERRAPNACSCKCAAVDLQDLLCAAPLHDLAIFQDHHAAEAPERLRPVGRREHRGHREVVHDTISGNLLRVRVQGGSAFVQQQHGRLPDQHPRDTQELLLAEADVGATRAHRCVQAPRRRASQGHQCQILQRLPQAPIRVLVEWVQVLSPRAPKEHRLLWHNAHDRP